MRSRTIALPGLLLWAGVLLAASPVSAAEPSALQTEVRQTDALAAQQGATRVESRMAAEFTAFAGSEANAQSLVTGLRTGSPITLASPSAGGTTTTTLTFDPPTRPMGHGNVYISLALAKQQLANYGITDPTPQEIQAALTGGTITSGSGATAQTVTLNGILTQRADGMGWGALARAEGMNLGQVVSGLKRANTSISAAPASGGGAGITTATNAGARSGAAASSQLRGNSAQAPGHNRVVSGSGIVTATGARVGTVGGAGAQAGARSGSAGIVTGAAAGGGANNANAQAKGLLKQ